MTELGDGAEVNVGVGKENGGKGEAEATELLIGVVEAVDMGVCMGVALLRIDVFAEELLAVVVVTLIKEGEEADDVEVLSVAELLLVLLVVVALYANSELEPEA